MAAQAGDADLFGIDEGEKAGPFGDGEGGQVLAIVNHFSGYRGQKAGHGAQESAFAGTVAAGHDDKCAGRDYCIEAGKDGTAAVAYGKVFNFYHKSCCQFQNGFLILRTIQMTIGMPRREVMTLTGREQRRDRMSQRSMRTAPARAVHGSRMRWSERPVMKRAI